MISWILALALSSQEVDFGRDVQPVLKASCFKCHSGDAPKGELRLDRKAAALQGGASGRAIIPGNASASRLVRLLEETHPDERMPRKAAPLPRETIALVRRWIDQGAAWPDSADRHWAYVQPARPDPPRVRDAAWGRTPIDAFVLARLEKEGISPSPEAPRETLLRRVSLDLTGLPPSPAELDAFLADPSPDAYEKAVDRLLASPHHGERWARPWLDLARYADSIGYNLDTPRPVWKYRDWVIRALNDDMPFDRFTIEQVAGDLLPGATADQKTATGFHRNNMFNEEQGADPEEKRWETLIDRVNTTATVWLGTTFACAQCHDHKFDPFTQKEYYQLLAFFDRAVERDLRFLTPEERSKVEALEAEAAKLDAKARGPKLDAARKFGVTTVVFEEGLERETHVRVRGAFLEKGERALPGTPASLPPMREGSPRNRLGLARWLVDPDNPLVARVVVNRAWEQYFGRGLIDTPEDFGSQGHPPSHPELLDRLATGFAETWSLKKLHRLIVTSATYRQSSRVTPALLARDPLNRLLARGPRFRMEAEMIRDSFLAASGLLSRKMGGPGVFPPMPDGAAIVPNNSKGQKWLTSQGEDRHRRAIYTFWRRASMYPAFLAFDAQSRRACVVSRSCTNTPLQALFGLNDPAFFEAARALARRVTEGAKEPQERVRLAFRLCVSRLPTAEETRLLLEELRREREHFEKDAAAAEALLKGLPAEALAKAGPADPELAAWTVVANILFNLDETLTKE